MLSRLSRGVSRPYLPVVPDSYGAQLEVFEWLERLLATAGVEGTREALSYYESIGWLSADSRSHLDQVLEGLSAASTSDPRTLSVTDHRESLLYVARLSHRLDR